MEINPSKETEIRLRSYLNRNPLDQERMCVDILNTIDEYKEINPVLPKGGPDGGKDIISKYMGNSCIGAVGFINDSHDSQINRNTSFNKFKSDADSVAINNVKYMVFFTNVTITPLYRSKILEYCKKKGIIRCDIFDLERIRSILDSVKGYAIRYRYLKLPMSDSEQKEFFDNFYRDIINILQPKIDIIDKITSRTLFLLESQKIVSDITAYIKLKEGFSLSKSNDFIIEINIILDGLHRSAKSISIISEGLNTEDSYTMVEYDTNSSIHRKILEENDYLDESLISKASKSRKSYRSGLNLSIFLEDIRSLYISSSNRSYISDVFPKIRLMDLDHSMLIIKCNKDLCDKIENIDISVNGYCILSYNLEEFLIIEDNINDINIISGSKNTDKLLSSIGGKSNWLYKIGNVRDTNKEGLIFIYFDRETPQIYKIKR